MSAPHRRLPPLEQQASKRPTIPTNAACVSQHPVQHSGLSSKKCRNVPTRLLWILWLASILVTWSLSRGYNSDYRKRMTLLRKEEGCHETGTGEISFRKPKWMKSLTSRGLQQQSLLATQINSITDFIDASNIDRAILDEQVQIQQVFQQIIHDIQHPSASCDSARGHKIVQVDPLDGFAVEFQSLARHLHTAIASHRLFEIPVTWKSAYAPPGCNWSASSSSSVDEEGEPRACDFLCLWQPVTNCTEGNMEVSDKEKDETLERVENPLPNGYGIISDTSPWFDTRFYGPQRRVDDWNDGHWYSVSSHPDIIPYWDRIMGRFWVRAQMAHYLWRPSAGLQSEIDKRLSDVDQLMDGTTKFIGMHIRKTDNTVDLQSDFGRDSNVTRSADRFLTIAEAIRKENADIDTIYLATDNSRVVKEMRKVTEDRWKVLVQKNVKRSKSTKYLWFWNHRAFGAASIATDIEVLRRADYLIGSHQSNVYRLATELNTAWNVGNYPLRLNRLRTVDISWYEHP